MKNILLFFLWLILVSHGAIEAAFHFKRPNGSTGIYYFDKTNISQDKNFSIVLMLQGSEVASVGNFMALADSSWLKEVNAACLAIEKPGVSANSFNESEYLSMNSLWQRADDCREILKILRKNELRWNGKLLIVGASEGATLAAYLSPLIQEAVGVILFSGGCGMTLHDEIQLLEDKKKSQGVKEFLDKQMTKAYLYTVISLSKWLPHSTYTCIGRYNTLKYWNTIGNYNPLISLDELNIPIYCAHGTHDENCPIESAKKLVTHFKKKEKANLTYRFYDGYDHNFFDVNGKNHWDEVADEALEWAQIVLQ